MRKALKSKSGNRGQISGNATLIAPVGGWNARDPDADMDEKDARVLDNMFPSVSSVINRSGSSDWSTGYPGTVDTIMTYAGATSEKLFGASGTSIYDGTAQGAVGAAVVTGLSSVRLKYTNLAITSGHYMYVVNGVDKPRLYDGTNWTAIDSASVPAITGVTTTLLSDVMVWKRRLFFTEVNSLHVWYLPIDSIGGAASQIDFGPLFKLGGSIVTLATWTIDGGNGMDDHLAIITNQGEVAIYQGTDPSSAANFALVGVFALGSPVSLKPCTKYAGDLVLLTLDGLLPLSKALLSTRTNNRIAISDKISKALSDSTSSYQNNYGWQVFVFPRENMLIVNIPMTSSISIQYVMNTITGSWCSFSGWNAKSFELLNDNLYFGTSGKICKAWTGASDSNAPIRCIAKQAYSYFGKRGPNKQWKMARPTLTCNLPPSLSIGMNIDYQDSTTSIPVTSAVGGAGAWGSGIWGSAIWGGSQTYRSWRTITGYGNAGSFYLQFTSSILNLQWSSTDFIFEYGGIVI